MTWGPIVAQSSKGDIQNALNEAWATFQQYNLDSVPVGAALDQVNGCLNWVGALAASGSVGENPKVIISGHAHPGHVPVDGYPPESISIQIVDTT
jgi:hypothetical protein